MNNREQIDQLATSIAEGGNVFNGELDTLRVLMMNVKITLAHLDEHPEIRALAHIASVIEESVKKIETATDALVDISNQIKELNKEE